MKTLILVLIVMLTQCSVPLTCSEATAQSECKPIINGINECIWQNDKCSPKACELLPVPCDNQKYGGLTCSTSGSSCKGVTQCSEIDNANSCGLAKPVQQQCYWNDVCRVKTCSDNAASDCYNTNGQYCAYQKGECQTIISCSQVQTEQYCLITNELACSWQIRDGNGYCTTYDCTTIAEAESCFKTEIRNEKCFYGQDSNGGANCLSCTKMISQCDCEYYNIYGCQWKNEQCREVSCQAYTNSSDCGKAYDSLTCTWYPPTQKCVTIEEANSLDRKCDIYIYGEMLVTLALFFLIQ